MDFSLWPACVKTHSFAEQLRAAAAGGFDSLPIGTLTYRSLRDSGLSAAEIAAMAAEHGVRLGHYDGFADWAPGRCAPELPAAARAVFDVSSDECLEICHELGLKAVCATGVFTAGTVELPALIDGFAAFCERAQAAGVNVDLEFIPMWGIPTLGLAWDIVRAAGASNSGVLLDTWHFLRGCPDVELLRAMPAGSITTVQVADALGAVRGGGLFEECIRFRQLPGEGDLALIEVLTILRDKGGVRSIGPEVFSDQLDRLDAIEAARRAASATEAVLAQAGWTRPAQRVG